LSYFRDFPEDCLGLFQYSLLHLPQARGSFFSAGSQVCPQRPQRHALTQTIPNFFGMTALPISRCDTTIGSDTMQPKLHQRRISIQKGYQW